MDAQPSTSRGFMELSPRLKRPNRALSATEKMMVINTHKYVFEEQSKQIDEFEKVNISECAAKVANILGISSRTVKNVMKNHEENKPELPKSPKKRGRKLTFKEKLDDFTLWAIRRIVHSFFHNNEHPTIEKVTNAINEDPDLPTFSKETTRKIMRHLNFKYAVRSRKSILIDKTNIMSWRQRYLHLIKKYRSEGRYIYYQDETWINAGHTLKRAWTDTTIQSSREAFLEGLSTGLRSPSRKGKRFIISHIGGEEGFVENGLLMFESKKGGDYHEEMNAECFEEWFAGVLNELKPNSVVVMDNAPYHSRKIDSIPKMSWKKEKIQEWLRNKNIEYEPNMVKIMLIDLAKKQNQDYEKYAVDEMAAEKGIALLRLPPYHCELNPIELIWAQVKGHVARNNKTYKMQDVKELFLEGINKVTASKWSDCIAHVKKEEDKMCHLDHILDQVTDSFIINLSHSECDSDSE